MNWLKNRSLLTLICLALFLPYFFFMSYAFTPYMLISAKELASNIEIKYDAYQEEKQEAIRVEARRKAQEEVLARIERARIQERELEIKPRVSNHKKKAPKAVYDRYKTRRDNRFCYTITCSWL